MNVNEIARYGLMAAMAVLAYFMLLAWNEDSAQRQASEQSVVATPLPSSFSGPAEAAEDGLPTAFEAEPSADEIPGLAASPVSSAATEGVLIETDVLRLRLDAFGDPAYAALRDHPVSLEATDQPFVMLEQRGGFTYLARSGLVGTDGLDGAGRRARFSASQEEFRLAPGAAALEIPLVHEDLESGLRVEKRYTLARGDHAIRVTYHVENRGAMPRALALYGQLKRSPGLAPGQSENGMGPRSYVGAAFTTAESRYEKVDFDDLDDAPFSLSQPGGWLAMLQHYFLAAWVPSAGDQTLRYSGRALGDGTYVAEFVQPQVTVSPGAAADFEATLYVGPKAQARLEALAPNLSLTVDYGFLWWIAVPLFQLLELLNHLVHNWGLAIILLTLTVKLLLYPLSAAAYRSMANMKKFAPEMRRLQELHSDNRQKLSEEMMALYKKEKINPMGGCLPMLLQMPVFLALYWVLYESVELRQAPFLFWIQDLAAIDPYFVLPLLMGATMYFQQTLNPPPPDPMQARVMKLMPVMFTALFLFFPSGLVLYWLTNNVLSIAQQWWITRQIEAAASR
jgi:YidC/Oxa1 family membrane protein insertase